MPYYLLSNSTDKGRRSKVSVALVRGKEQGEGSCEGVKARQGRTRGGIGHRASAGKQGYRKQGKAQGPASRQGSEGGVELYQSPVLRDSPDRRSDRRLFLQQSSYRHRTCTNPSNASSNGERAELRATIDLSFAALFHDHFSHGDHAARIFDGDRSFAHSLSKK